MQRKTIVCRPQACPPEALRLPESLHPPQSHLGLADNPPDDLAGGQDFTDTAAALAGGEAHEVGIDIIDHAGN